MASLGLCKVSSVAGLGRRFGGAADGAGRGDSEAEAEAELRQSRDEELGAWSLSSQLDGELRGFRGGARLGVGRRGTLRKWSATRWSMEDRHVPLNWERRSCHHCCQSCCIHDGLASAFLIHVIMIKQSKPLGDPGRGDEASGVHLNAAADSVEPHSTSGA